MLTPVSSTGQALPAVIVPLLTPFAPMFQARTWMKVQVLLIGAILATRKRTVTSALRTMGLSDDIGFARYHHVLNRAEWSPLQLSRVLLSLLVQCLDGGDSPLVFGIDETLERRRGSRFKAKGIYRDAVRSSGSHFVKASVLRWISLMLLTNIPWAHRTWALPVLTALAPSERYCQQMGRTHKRLIDWARQMIIQARRWVPNRPVVMVADSSYAALDLLAFCQSMTRPVTFITRLRPDAVLYEPAPPRLPGQMGRPRLKGRRLPTLAELLECPEIGWTAMSVAWYDGATRVVEVVSQTAVWYHAGKPPVSIRWVIIRDPLHQFDSQALLCTDPAISPVQIIEWFVLRWQLEVTLYPVRGKLFQEVRSHLRVETQRQWSDLAIARTTPALFVLFSWVTLAAHALGPGSNRTRPLSSLVSQGPAHLLRCYRSGPTSPVVKLRRFRHIACSTQHPKTPSPHS